MTTVLRSLEREHRVFEDLIRRLEGYGDLPPELGRARLAEALLVLLPALERHDAIEAEVFGSPGRAPTEESRRAHEIVAAQHEAIRALREEIEGVLRREDGAPLARLQALCRTLAAKLAWHFRTEELLLWPLRAAEGGPPEGKAAEKRASESVEALRAEVARLSAAARDYVEGP